MRRISINRLLYYLLLLFPISIMLQGLPGCDSINRILMGGITGLLAIQVLRKINRPKVFIMVCVAVGLHIVALYNTKESVINPNCTIYFILWILLFLYLENEMDIFEQYLLEDLAFLKHIIILWNALVVVSLFFSKSYIYTWGGVYFISFTTGAHRFAGVCLFMIGITWLLIQITSNKKYYLLLMIPIAGIFACGARTYLGVVLIFIICMFYMHFKNKQWFYVWLIPLLLLIAIIIYVSPMKDKILNTFEIGYWGYWGTITNGRSVFWEADLREFWQLGWFQRWFGNGFNFVYHVNKEYFAAEIWAHNDFINILLNFGIVGVFVYCFVLLSFLKKFYCRFSKIPILLKVGFFLIWFINAMFNMVYTYVSATIAIPFIVLAFAYPYKQHETEKVEKWKSRDYSFVRVVYEQAE